MSPPECSGLCLPLCPSRFTSVPGPCAWPQFLPQQATPSLPALFHLLCGWDWLVSPLTALSAPALCSPLPSPGGKAGLIYCDTWSHMEVPSGDFGCSCVKSDNRAWWWCVCFFSLLLFLYFVFHSWYEKAKPATHPNSTVMKPCYIRVFVQEHSGLLDGYHPTLRFNFSKLLSGLSELFDQYLLRMV